VLHLYAVVPTPAGALHLGNGLEGAPLRLVDAGPLGAVVSEHDAPVAAGEEAVLRHARVVDDVARVVPSLLPSRFGDTLSDEAAVRARLRERAAGLLAALDAVAGCVELGLRVAERGSHGGGEREAVRPSGGREYMLALRERSEAGRRCVETVHEPLARLAERSTVENERRGALVLSAAYLVRRERVERMRAQVARLQEEHPGLALVCTGPWPPYSFAEPERAA
jgi:hypothetical protein